MARYLTVLVFFACLFGSIPAKADVFLDLSSVIAGGPGIGTFSGTLGSVSVTGSILSGPPVDLLFNPTGGGIDASTTDNSSPAYSYPSVFSPTNLFGDRVGWSSGGTTTNTILVLFSAPVTDPVFHVANMDSASFSFAATSGFSSLTLLNGNFGAGDGLFISGPAIVDVLPTSFDPTLPTAPPPTVGPRSAYGSVRINGTFSSLMIGAGTSGAGPDVFGGSFTFSTVPEPGSLIVVGLGALVVFCGRRWF